MVILSQPVIWRAVCKYVGAAAAHWRDARVYTVTSLAHPQMRESVHGDWLRLTGRMQAGARRGHVPRGSGASASAAAGAAA
ncbi:hypothetical protein [Paenibacillus sp. H1-7]|uniref:hypothetical protein n=1 Tax=Paenibacillus sp. H1-7 TaxID=2282849 RepID=UPI001EF8AF44|nr:hypothetical protein [Paenibacillus sp. H1-7]